MLRSLSSLAATYDLDFVRIGIEASLEFTGKVRVVLFCSFFMCLTV